jgi:hypothetical protein
MKTSRDLDWLGLERLYEEGRQLLLQGIYEEAIGRFKRIYVDTLVLRDVTEIVDDYYSLSREEWVAKYQARFKK